MWVFSYFRQELASGKVFQRRSIMTLLLQLSNKQIDPPNTFAQKERQS